MKLKYSIISICFLLALVCALPGGVSAAEANGSPEPAESTVSPIDLSSMDVRSMDIINNSELRDTVISNLESNGVDTSVLKAAISVGANGKVANILEYYKDKLQANPDYVNPTEDVKSSAEEKEEKNEMADEPTAIPTDTKSALSPFIALIGIAIAGCAAFAMKR